MRGIKTFSEYLGEEKHRLYHWYGVGSPAASERNVPAVAPAEMTRSEHMRHRARSQANWGSKQQIARVESGGQPFIRVEQDRSASAGSAVR